MDQKIASACQSCSKSVSVVRDLILGRGDLSKSANGKVLVAGMDDLLTQLKMAQATGELGNDQAGKVARDIDAMGPPLGEMINDNAKMSAMSGALNRSKLYDSSVTNAFVAAGRTAKDDMFVLRALLVQQAVASSANVSTGGTPATGGQSTGTGGQTAPVVVPPNAERYFDSIATELAKLPKANLPITSIDA